MHPQGILYVEAATQKRTSINISGSSAELIALHGTCFPIKQQDHSYYLYKNSVNHVCSETLKMWHKILGHCNVADVKRLEGVVQGMISSKFDYKTYSLAKQVNVRNK